MVDRSIASSQYLASMREVSVRDAAEHMGLSEQRVRALLKAGRIPGRKIGWSWVLDPEAGSAVQRPEGRPMSAKSGWGMLALLAGDDPVWLEPHARSRLRRWIRDRDIVQLLLQGESRSQIIRRHVLPADLPKLRSSSRLVLSGLSAPHVGLDIVPVGNILDAYGDERVVRDIERQFRPSSGSADDNLILRVPSHPWVLDHEIAPIPVVAADLLADQDPRVSRAARELLRSLVDG